MVRGLTQAVNVSATEGASRMAGGNNNDENASQSVVELGVASTADVAKTTAEDPKRNTLVLARKLRIQVLDVRSLEPVRGMPVEEAWISKLDGSDRKPLARFLGAEKDWAIETWFPIYKKGSSWAFGTAGGKTLGWSSQTALVGLGFDVGGASTGYFQQGKTAFLRYRLASGDVEMSGEAMAAVGLPDAEKLAATAIETVDGKEVLKGVTDVHGARVEFREPTTAEMEGIIKAYNTRAYRGAQFHLAALGYYPDGVDPFADGYFDEHEGGDWTDGWKQKFKDWQRDDLGYSNPWDWIKTASVGRRLREKQKVFVTDNQGVLSVPVPVNRIREGFRVGVSFKDFPVVAEATRKAFEANDAEAIGRDHRMATTPELRAGEPVCLGGMTRQRIPWEGPLHQAAWTGAEQKANSNLDGGIGWRWWLRHGEAASARGRQFRTSWVFEVPACDWAAGATTPTWRDVQDKTSALSMFFSSMDPVDPEFVLFAMQWCQPVYDGIKDAAPARRTATVTEASYNWPNANATDVHNGMHVVTQFYDMGGWDLFGGKGYGLYEHHVPGPTRWRGMGGSPGHHGVDVHAPVGCPVFAVHGGQASHSTSAGALGRRTNVSWKAPAGKRGLMGLGHLSDKIGAASRHVRAGELIGVGGRTGNLDAVSSQAGHVHLNIGATRNDLRDTPDEANKRCVPFNEHTPLLFPCACETTQYAAALRNCDFTNDEIMGWGGGVASTCWAVADLSCPKIPRSITSADLEGDAGSETTIKARRRVQAQLRKLGFYSKLPVSSAASQTSLTAAHRRALDGVFGSVGDTVKCTASGKGNVHAEAAGGAAIVGKIDGGSSVTWTDVSEVGGDLWLKVQIPAAAREGTSGQTEGWMHHSIVESPGESRLAIYRWKLSKGLIAGADPVASRFRLSDTDIAHLNADAQVVPLSIGIA
ncbi:MAG: hypothetical protein CMJ31_13850 [Phycisphaerae bacterium]|nr:hypothetical protein [Phycisphaerae bacterium]